MFHNQPIERSSIVVEYTRKALSSKVTQVVAAEADGGGRKESVKIKSEGRGRRETEQPRGLTRFGARLLILHRDNESPADLPVPFSCSWRQFQTSSCCFFPI